MDTLIPKILFPMIKINDFRGKLADISIYRINVSNKRFYLETLTLVQVLRQALTQPWTILLQWPRTSTL